MRILFFICFVVGFSNLGKTQDEIHTDSTENQPTRHRLIGELSPQEIALGVIEFLRNSDTSEYLNLAIPIEGKQLIRVRDFNSRTDSKESLFAELDSIEKRHPAELENFLIRSGYIHEIMIEDKGFKISEATIDTVIVDQLPANLFRGIHFERENWNMVTVVFNYKKEKFYFEIPQIVELVGRWYLYYPEFYLRDQSELDFVNAIRYKRN